MDKTGGFYPLDVGSSPAGDTSERNERSVSSAHLFARTGARTRKGSPDISGRHGLKYREPVLIQ